MSRKRIKKTRFLKGMLNAGLITMKDVPEIERRLGDYKTGEAINRHYWKNNGWRVVEKIKNFGKWLWQHREEILRILGIIVMFADDGTPTIHDKDDWEKKNGVDNKDGKKTRLPDPEDEVPPPDEVEDFTDEEPAEEEEEPSEWSAPAPKSHLHDDYDLGLGDDE